MNKVQNELILYRLFIKDDEITELVGTDKYFFKIDFVSKNIVLLM